MIELVINVDDVYTWEEFWVSPQAPRRHEGTASLNACKCGGRLTHQINRETPTIAIFCDDCEKVVAIFWLAPDRSGVTKYAGGSSEPGGDR